MISSTSFRHNLNFCPKTTAAMRYLAIAHQTFQPSWLVEVLNAMTNTSLNSSVGRASVYQTEGPEFNPRLGRKSFESFLNFYLINDVSAEGKSRFSYIMGITSSAIMKLPKIHFHQWFHQKASATFRISVPRQLPQCSIGNRTPILSKPAEE